EDQKQHVELTRDIAQRFNSLYGETFKQPEPAIPVVGARIMGLDDPTQKMSKSGPRPEHAIYLLDTPEVIRSKILRATTDSQREIRFDPSRPGIYNLLVIYELFTEQKRATIEAQFEGKGYADFKRALAEVIIDGLRPVQSRYQDLAADPTYIDAVLNEGAQRVRPCAETVLRRGKKHPRAGRTGSPGTRGAAATITSKNHTSTPTL